MFKVKILLIALFLLTIVAVESALEARINHIIYTPDPVTTTKCNVPLTGRTMLPVAEGTLRATTLFNSACVAAIAIDVEN